MMKVHFVLKEDVSAGGRLLKCPIWKVFVLWVTKRAATASIESGVYELCRKSQLNHSLMRT